MACTVMWRSPAEPASVPRGLKYQPYTLMQPKQQIHAMHRIACPAFQQIIYRHSDYKLPVCRLHMHHSLVRVQNIRHTNLPW